MENSTREADGSAIKRLIQTWVAWEVTIRPGVPEDELVAFEAKHHAQLPPDFRDYLRLCNGFKGWGGSHGNDDRGFIDFLPMQEMELIPAGEETCSTQRPTLPVTFLSFADYLLSSHLYAICLSPDPTMATPVVLWADKNLVRPIAGSFNEFVQVYLDEPERLWPRS